MTNKEVFEQYNTEKWVMREQLSYMLMEYAEKAGVTNPPNPIAFLEDFMKSETLVNTKYAEQSKMDTLNKSTIIDV